MLETDENVETLLRIIGFLFLYVGAFPSMIFTLVFVIASIVSGPTSIFGLFPYLAGSYVASGVGYFLIRTARKFEKH